MVEYSQTEDDLIKEVRLTLGNIDASWISDDVILQAKRRRTMPKMESNIDDSEVGSTYPQEDIDAAIVSYTAYRAYTSKPFTSTVSGGGVTANMAVSQYLKQLREAASEAFSRLDMSMPSEDSPAAFVDKTEGMFR